MAPGLRTGSSYRMLKYFALVTFTLSPQVLSNQISLDEPPEVISHSDKLQHLPDISHANARALCKALNDSGIPGKIRFLWSIIKTKSDRPENAEHSEMDEELLVVKPTCHAYRWTPCSGTPRYPLPAKCGFFQIVPDEKCETAKAPEASLKDNSDIQILSGIILDNSRASELCAVVNKMPMIPNTPAAIRYVPVRVDVDPLAASRVTRDCVHWQYVACEPQEHVETCKPWKLFLTSLPNCKAVAEFFAPGRYNASSIKNRLQDKSSLDVDFFEEIPSQSQQDIVSTKNPESDLQRQIYPDAGPISDIDQNLIADLISCRVFNKETICSVIPKKKTGAERVKREERSRNSRYKRYFRRCCGPFGCQACSFRYQSLRYPEEPCDCGWPSCEDWGPAHVNACLGLRVPYTGNCIEGCIDGSPSG